MILEIFSYQFMIRAFEAGIIIGLIAPLIGLFLILRRYSLFADTLAHVSLLGVAVGVLANIQPVYSALVFAVLGALGIEQINTKRKIYGESVLALFLSGSLAAATVVLGFARGFNANLLSFLFGSITTVQASDIRLVAGLGLATLLVLYAIYKELFFISFDEEAARVAGLPVKALNLILMVLAAITVSLSIRIVGVLLISALMVIPGITAMQYRQSFRRTAVLAVIFSLLSVISGLFMSFYLGLASGGVIVLISLLFFLVSYLLKKEQTRRR